MGHRIFPTILREAGLAVECHDDHFPPDTEDECWLPVVGERGWTVLTHNTRIRYTPLQRDTFMRVGVRGFFLIGHATPRELAESFVRRVERVRAFLTRHEDPFMAKVYRDRAAIEMWLSYEEWARGRRPPWR